jgi:hypothetical protein
MCWLRHRPPVPIVSWWVPLQWVNPSQPSVRSAGQNFFSLLLCWRMYGEQINEWMNEFRNLPVTWQAEDLLVIFQNVWVEACLVPMYIGMYTSVIWYTLMYMLWGVVKVFHMRSVQVVPRVMGKSSIALVTLNGVWLISQPDCYLPKLFCSH